jgi:hypothetical protein
VKFFLQENPGLLLMIVPELTSITRVKHVFD